jgi:protein ImuB
MGRYVSIWLRRLKTDWMVRRQPELKDVAFVMASPERGRMIIKAAHSVAEAKGVLAGMNVADCRAILPSLQVHDDKPELAEKLLNALGEWCIRYTPVVAIDSPDGLILDASGCPHLWGGELPYLQDIINKLGAFGYEARAAMADTVGNAWAMAHYGPATPLVEPRGQCETLLGLPPAALRLEPEVIARLEKLGLCQINSFIDMPAKALRRRFGAHMLLRIDQALGHANEAIIPIQPIEPYQERLATLEPIVSATGIEIALHKLLEQLATRLAKEGKGLRKCVFKCYRIDGNIQKIEISTSSPSRHVAHLLKLVQLKISTIEPDLGIDVFTAEATVVEDLAATQETLWSFTQGSNSTAISELVDNIANKVGVNAIHRYLPAEHYWPERSVKTVKNMAEKPLSNWRTDLPRPIHLLLSPEKIAVSVALPDYPPMLFRYKGALHNIEKAEGPERIEQEWWLQHGLYRDYYIVEDEHGARYWLFRAGSYEAGTPEWFIHGFFA